MVAPVISKGTVALSIAHKREKAFTLIELLVVTVILAILAGLVMAGATVARERARQARCVSNLHQMALSMILYAEDHDGSIPSFVFQANPLDEISSTRDNGHPGIGRGRRNRVNVTVQQKKKLADILGSWTRPTVVSCPSDRWPDPISVVGQNGELLTLPFSYSLNFEFLAYDQPMKLLANPHETILLYDGTPSHSAGIYVTHDYNSRYARFPHLGRTYAAFADSHVEQLATILDLHIRIQP